MSWRRLKLPAPWGNQPDDPADIPLATFFAQSLGRYVCLAGYGREPPRECLLGRRAECVWGIRSREDRWCMWRYLERMQGQETLPSHLAPYLGVSKERARKLVDSAMEALECKVKTDSTLAELLTR